MLHKDITLSICVKITQNKGQEGQFMSDLDVRKKEARLTP